jgi:hypothetical protein
MPDVVRYPLFNQAKGHVFDQHAGEALIVPPGWFAQWFSVSETLGTVVHVLNQHNYGAHPNTENNSEP